MILYLEKDPFIVLISKDLHPSINDFLDFTWSSFGAISEMLTESTKSAFDSNCFFVLKNCNSLLFLF